MSNEIPREDCIYKSCYCNINGDCKFGNVIPDYRLPCFERYPLYFNGKIIDWYDASDDFEEPYY